MKIKSHDLYRSMPLVNRSYDRVRVCLLLHKWEWIKIRQFLKENAWEKEEEE